MCVCVCACEVLRVFIWIISHLAAQRKEVRTVDHNNSMMDRLYTQKATHEHAHTPKHTGTPLWATCLHVVNLSSECHLIKVNNQDYDHWSLDHETRIWGWVLFEHYKVSEHFFILISFIAVSKTVALFKIELNLLYTHCYSCYILLYVPLLLLIYFQLICYSRRSCNID